MRISVNALLILKQLKVTPGLRTTDFIFPFDARRRYTVHVMQYLRRKGLVYSERKGHRGIPGAYYYYYLTAAGELLLEATMEMLNADTQIRRTNNKSNDEPLPVGRRPSSRKTSNGVDHLDPLLSALALSHPEKAPKGGQR